MIDEKKLIDEIKENVRLHNMEDVDSYIAIMNIIESQPKVSEWIPVEERLPKEGELYWFIDSYGYVCSEFEYDEWFIKHKTVFRTREEVQQYKRYLDVLDKYKYEFTDEEWKDCNLEKWVIKYFCNNQTLHVFSRFVGKYSNCTYFKSKEDAKAFIKEVGEENVKRFMFDVWD